MGSAHLGSGVGLTDTGPSASGAREWRLWFRARSFTSSQYLCIGGMCDAVNGSHFVAVDTEETAAGDINVFIYDNGAYDVCTVKSGSFTGWGCVRITNAASSANYPVYWQEEGSSSWTLVDTLTVGRQVTETTLLYLGQDGFSNPTNTDVRKHHVSTTIDSDGTAFTNSRNLSFNGSGNAVDLPLTSGASAGTNNGTGGNWTVGGSPTDEASEPSFSSAITGDGALVASAATLAASGAPVITGTGALAPSAATLAAAGAPIISGTGALAPSAATLAASGAPIIHGTAALAPAAATLSASGSNTTTGDAALVADAATLAAAGAPVVHGTGALAPSAATLSAAGGPVVHGTAALASAAATLAAVGAAGPLIERTGSTAADYLTDANNGDAPFRIKGFANWLVHLQIAPLSGSSYPNSAGSTLLAGQTAFFEKMVEHGVNFVPIQVLTKYNSDAPEDSSGDEPHSGGFLTTPVQAYFDRCKALVALAASYGIVIGLAVGPWAGYDSSQGFYTDIEGTTNAVMEDWGEYVAQQFGGFDNIIYILMGDRPSPSATLLSREAAVATGIRNFDTRHLITAHVNFAASDNPATTGATDLTSCYRWDGGLVPVQVEDEYLENDAPVLVLEALYEENTGFGATLPIIRQQHASSLLNGALCGYVGGHEGVWHAGGGNPGSQPNLPSQSTGIPYDLDCDSLIHAKAINQVFDARRWWELVPEHASGDLITAGRGTHDTTDYVTAARDATSGTTLAIIYIPDGRAGASITVDMTEFSGAVTALWYDPTDPTASPVPATGSPIAASGTHNFVASTEVGTNDAGDDDWILVLETDTNAVALVPAAATLAASGAPIVHGTAAATIGAATLAATGGPIVSGSAALAASAATLAAAGAPLVTGAAALAPDAATLAASGTTLVHGTAALNAAVATLSALGEGASEGTTSRKYAPPYGQPGGDQNYEPGYQQPE